MKPDQTADEIDAAFMNVVRGVLEPRGLWGETQVLRNGVISAGNVVVDLNKQIVFIVTAKDRTDPETVSLAQALEEAVGGVAT